MGTKMEQVNKALNSSKSEILMLKNQVQNLEESIQTVKDSNNNLELQIAEKNKEIEMSKTTMNEKIERAGKIRNLARKFKTQFEEAETKNKELETKWEEEKQQKQKLEEEITKLKTVTSSGVDNSKDDETQTEAAADNSVQQTPNDQA